MILLLKLVSNLELIGELVSIIPGRLEGRDPVDDDLVRSARAADAIVFRRLRFLAYQQQPGGVNISFQPLLAPAGDADLPLETRHILVLIEAPAKVADAYREATTQIVLSQGFPTRAAPPPR